MSYTNRSLIHQEQLRNAQKHHEDVYKLEGDITTLGDMFIDMDNLVKAQDQKILSIEEHVERTEAHIESADEHVTSAIKTARKSRKKKWILLLVSIILLAIAAVLLYIYLNPIFNPDKNKPA